MHIPFQSEFSHIHLGKVFSVGLSTEELLLLVVTNTTAASWPYRTEKDKETIQ